MNTVSKNRVSSDTTNDLKPAVDWTSIDTTIKHEGTQIVLPGEPGEMPIDAAIATLNRVKADEAQEFDVTERVTGAPWDAITAIYRAMQDKFGVVSATSTMSFFGPILPDMLTIKTGPKASDVIQVPVGSMALPNFNSKIKIGIYNGGAYLTGKVRKRDRATLVEIAARARKIMETDSIYKGKAIRLKVDDDGNLDINDQPEFIDLAGVQESDAIHTAETEALIRTNVYAPLKFTEACRANKIPLKRGILLEGKYGTGKSLTARVTAKVATDNEWTFIMLDRSQGLKSAIEFARTYQPCVIFAEDIDRAADRDEEDVNDLVNLIDGVITKSMEMMVVLTTNFVERIDRALLRPGRFDAVISIQAPDAETVGRLVRAYGRGANGATLLPNDIDLTKIGQILDGQIPATIREVVERAKLSMLTHGGKMLSSEDLEIAAIGMKRHLELLDPKTVDETPQQKLWDAMTAMVTDATIGYDSSDITDSMDGAKSAARQARDTSVKTAREIAEARANVVALAESFHELNGKFDKVFGKLTAGR